jgi:hypothetical protein
VPSNEGSLLRLIQAKPTPALNHPAQATLSGMNNGWILLGLVIGSLAYLGALAFG